MVEIYLIIFTSMEPLVPPKLQEVLVYNMESCTTIMDTTSPEFDKLEGLVYTMRCERREVEEEK